jgi:hypothetical protein
MRRVDFFMRHARRLKEKAGRARRLASAIAGDVSQERLLLLAERLDARSEMAQHCAEEAIRREATRRETERGAAETRGDTERLSKSST